MPVTGDSGSQAAAHAVGDALVIFKNAMRPVAEERLAAAYGPDWAKTLALVSKAGIAAKNRGLGDASTYVDLLKNDATRQKAFTGGRGERDSRVKAAVEQLYEVRVRWAHTDPLDLREAWRGLDAVRRLLDQLGAGSPGAEEELGDLERRISAAIAGPRTATLDELRAEYVDSTLRDTQNADLGGISTRLLGSLRTVRLEDVYVVPQLIPASQESNAGSLVDPDRLIESTHAVILGDPGAGKSTLLRWLERSTLSDAAPLRRTPIRFAGRELATHLEQAPDLGLRQFLVGRHSERFGELFAHELDLGRVLLLIDGVDEVGDESLRHRVSAVITAFARDFPSVRMVVASRVVGYRVGQFGSTFTEYTIAPLDLGRIAGAILAWERVGHAEVASMAELKATISARLADLQASQGARELASNPLLLTLLILLWRQGARLPTRRADLYAAAVETLLRDWPARRSGARLNSLRLMDLLGPIATLAVSTNLGGLRELAVRDALSNWFAEASGYPPVEAASQADDVLRVVEEQTGILAEVGIAGGERVYDFLHRSFAEYLAARHLLAEWRRGKLALEPVLHDAARREVVALMFPQVASWEVAEAERFVADALAAPDDLESYIGVHRNWVLQGLSDGIKVPADQRDDIVAAALAWYVDPPAEPFRSAMGTRLVSLVPTLGLDYLRRRIGEARTDDPATQAKLAVLLSRADPSDDAALRDALARLPQLGSEPDEVSAEAGALLGPLGAQSVGDEPIPGATHLLFPPVGLPFEIPAGLVARLRGLVREVDVRSLAGSAGEADFADWTLVDFTEIESLTVHDLVEIASRPEDEIEWVLARLWELSESWHEQQAEAILALARNPTTVPPRLATFALGWARGLLPGNWYDVLMAVARAGEPTARRETLGDILASLGEGPTTEGFASIADSALADPDPDIRAMVPMALTEEIGREYQPDLVRRCQLLATQDPSPAVRSAALRMMLAHRQYTNVFSILANPDLYQDLLRPSADGSTGDLLDVIETEDAGDRPPEERRALTDAAHKLMQVGGPPWRSPLARFFPLTKGPSEALYQAALRASLDERWEARAWAALTLTEKPRDWPAGATIARLLADEHPRVRTLAANIVSEVDIESGDGWLEVAMESVTTHGPSDAARILGDELREMLPPTRLPELRDWMALLLASHPSSPSGRMLAMMLYG